jgi:hypothetical protein
MRERLGWQPQVRLDDVKMLVDAGAEELRASDPVTQRWRGVQ